MLLYPEYQTRCLPPGACKISFCRHIQRGIRGILVRVESGYFLHLVSATNETAAVGLVVAGTVLGGIAAFTFPEHLQFKLAVITSIDFVFFQVMTLGHNL